MYFLIRMIISRRLGIKLRRNSHKLIYAYFLPKLGQRLRCPFFMQYLLEGRELMFKITTDQINQITAVISKPLASQKPVFEALELSPYDSESEDQLDICGVAYESDIQERIDLAIEEPYEYLLDLIEVSEFRQKQLERGAPASDEELKLFREKYIETFSKSDGVDTFAIIDKISDGSISYWLFSLQIMMGQGGIGFCSFEGFYDSDEKAEKARNELEGIVLV